MAWHHEGKQFICSHSDGTLTIWNVKSPTKPFQTITPHGKIENACPLCLTALKAQWDLNFNGSILKSHVLSVYFCSESKFFVISSSDRFHMGKKETPIQNLVFVKREFKSMQGYLSLRTSRWFLHNDIVLKISSPKYETVFLAWLCNPRCCLNCAIIKINKHLLHD